MLEVLKTAINDRKEIEFTYSGLRRVAQAAAVGELTTGNIALRCFQTEGGHITPGHEWDLCLISDITDINVSDNVFLINPPGYRRGNKHMVRIFAQL
ncbi:hypothetical protein [Vibrio diazotrophicus]|uniref:hypothetical protein n=1 Tax=Vibrio diazotrophicus TaxID=685 RepID=UPI0005A63E62|nr:hypothetical protein [Vibrio diazotrophicus]